jgi:HSP20 family protein
MNPTIEETIERVERLYAALTGKHPSQSNGQRAQIPPEADPMVHVQEQLARLVSSVEQIAPSPAAAPAWIPRTVAWDDDNDLVLAIDAPGVLARDVVIRVEPFAIIVTGQRRTPWTQQPRTIAACDALFGVFGRSFPLPGRVSPDQVSARLDDGVLTIRVHTGARPQTSQIPIVS